MSFITTSSPAVRSSFVSRFFALLLPAVPLLLGGCSSVELASVVDTQFLLTTRDLPFNSVLLVYDTRDLAVKQEFEHSFAEYLRENTAAQVYTDIDLYSPLKKMEDKEKTWALRDNNIVAVLYVQGGRSDRMLRDWLLPEAADIDVELPAWKSSAVKMFLPGTGTVIWAGNIAGQIGAVGEELLGKSFFSAVTSDLIRRGILEAPRVENPAMRGFNR